MSDAPKPKMTLPDESTAIVPFQPVEPMVGPLIEANSTGLPTATPATV